jgi:hypothetical protein
MDYIEAVLKAAGEEDDILRELLEDWYDHKEIQDHLSDTLRSKINRDGISRELQRDVESTCTIPDLDDPPELPERSDGDPVTVRRYFDTSKFASFLCSGLWFSRIDLFGDNYEGKVGDETLRERWDTWEYSEMEGDPAPFDIRDMYRASDEIVRKQSFVSSWRYGGDESKVFWDAYIGQGPGVAIETTLENLEAELENVDRDVLIGKVNYKQYTGSTEPFARDSIDRMFHKRTAFGDEQELRLLARQRLDEFGVELGDGKRFDVDIDAEPGFNLSVDPDELVDKIILPPETNDREITKIVHLMDHQGLEAEVWRSRLEVSAQATAPTRVTGDDEGEIVRDDMGRVRRIDKSKYRD